MKMNRSRQKSFGIYTLLFLAVCTAAFFAFFIEHKSFVWKSDGYRQYYPALSYLRQYTRTVVSHIFNGNFSLPMMDYTIGQGEDIITTFANYGLGDPLVFLVSLLPGNASLECLYGVLVILRLYLSGTTFLVYCEGMKMNRRYSVYGALIYVFCGFALWSVKDPFFLNAMIYLPLVLLGIEFVLRKKTPLLLVLSVFFSIVSGYYFFYMIVVCAAGYFFARCYMLYGKMWSRWIQKGLACAAVSVAGVLLSAALFLPCIYGFAESSRTEAYVSWRSLLLYPLEYYKNMFLHLFVVTGNDDAGAVGYLSMAVVVLAVLFVLIRKKEPKYRALKVCAGICILAAASPFAGYVLNGFGYITNRFMFIPAFVFSLVLVLFLPELFAMEREEKKKLVWVCSCYGVVCVLLTSKEGIWQTVAMLAVLLGMLAALCVRVDKRWVERVLCGLIVLNLMLNGSLLYSRAGTGMTDAYMDAGSVAEAYEDSDISDTQWLCGDLSRMDVMFDHGENPNQSVAGQVFRYFGISVYYSVINSGYSRYMMSLENTPDLMYTHRILGNDGRMVLENLANVQYVLSEEEALVPYGFEKCEGAYAGKHVYKNQNKTSIGYTYDTWVTEQDFDGANVFERQGTLLKAAVPETGSAFARAVSDSRNIGKGAVSGEWNSLPFEMTDVRHFDWSAGRLKVKKRNGTFSISIQRKAGYEYYLRFSGLELENSKKNTAWASVKMGELSKSFLISDRTYDFYFGRSDYLVNLGTPKNGSGEETLTFTINGPARYRLDDIELVEVPVKDMAEDVAELNRESLQDTAISGNSLSGTLNLSEEKVLCLAVPYKKGYTLYVDGKETQIGRVNKMYIGAVIPEGEHSIVLKYFTPGLKTGMILTMFGVIHTIFLLLFHKKCCAK